MSSNNRMEMINAYKKYTRIGFACLPTGIDKMPSIPKGATWVGGWTSEKEYITSHGIGLLGGKSSKGLECIDFDNHFGDAKQVISDFWKIEGVKDIIEKYKLPIESTVSGGFHLLFRCDLNEGNQKLASRPKFDEDSKKTRADVLIETRGEGGYFVVDPTPGYKVVKNDIFIVNFITAEDRGVLLSACRSFNKHVKVYNKPDEEKDKVGDIFNRSQESLDEMISALKNDGWKELKEGLWQRPGKNKGISATLGTAARGIFYNFSSSADPFESEKGYTAFQVVGLLKYNGDFKSFAKELHEKYDTKEYKPELKKPEPKTEKQIGEMLNRALINLDIPVAKPPVIMRIKTKYGQDYIYSRMLTLGNFSAVTGKSKSKKTYLCSLILAAAAKNDTLEKVFKAEMPESKNGVALFDTEQSSYDAYVTAHRVRDITKERHEHFGAFDLREFSPDERCEIIDRYFQKGGSQTGLVIIDGIADLANAINDEIEASRVVSLLMKWTKVYNTHIMVVIHQNKDNNYATGHLGSAIIKKAECVIAVTKDEDDNMRSEVRCDLIRGTMEFDKFTFIINEKGLPEVEFRNAIQPDDPFKGQV
jgi:hypothetical protein